ncbi:MAG: glycosyltransferase family 4 protein [Patescibacteria group bacterium]|nr:glycosyltransferase family 4 protein [Patescibacteria group bacterium]
MKIGIFTECYSPVMNGVAVSVETFKKALEEKGHEVFIFTPEHPEAEDQKNVYRFPSITDPKGRLYPIFFPLVDIEKIYLPEDVMGSLDIIHAQHMFTAGRLARYVARKYDKPLVHTYHTLIAEYTHYAGVFSLIVRAYLKNMSKRFCNTCDQVITPSKSMKKILLKYKVTKPIDVVMTGIDPKAYRHRESKELREKYNIDKDDKILLYLSRIAKEKNLDFLFKAFVKIKKAYPKCHLLMVGGGPEEKWCKERIKELKIQKSVTLTGMLPKEDANKAFGMADLFTFPSYTETQGIVVAEAMASGTPPVAVGKMGPTDLIHDGKDGFLTKLEIKDFVDKTLKLLEDDELREKFAKEGLSRIDEFSTETSVRELLKIYEKAIDKKQEELEAAALREAS